MSTVNETVNGNGDVHNVLNGSNTAQAKRAVQSKDVLITSTSSTTSSSTNTNTNTSNGKQLQQQQQEEIISSKRLSSNSSTQQTATNGNTTTTYCDDYTNDLKIIGQLKNIEKINEKRRIFLHNTINESKTEETNGVATVNEKRTEVYEEQKEEAVEALKDVDSGETVLLRAPTTAPPKPPLLNRSSLSSPPPTPTATAMAMATATEIRTPTSPVTSTRITSAIIPEPIKVTTIQLKEENVPIMRTVSHPDRPLWEEPLPYAATAKQISTNHYDRLIEELKCPGCAAPMKAPILLCASGHSLCEQCTRILMLCPLCKEPFTKQRSLTVEALCSKAHFRCVNAAGGCSVRLQIDLLGWHQKQCIYKPMKCFMGRVWGDCQWLGREAYWKKHLEEEHANKVFKSDTIDLIWNMGIKQKPLTGYYVFQVFDEMFNFYEVYDKDRVIFTMACTSTVKEKKHNFAFEVTMIHEENEALAITQKFPVHSEYDKDILLEGTCASISLADLAKFIDEDRLLHYRVRILQVKSPRKVKMSRHSMAANEVHPIDFQQTQIQGVNLKNVPTNVIVTRKSEIDAHTDTESGAQHSSEDEVFKVGREYNKKIAKDGSGSESDPEFDAFIAKRWGTPQLNFNRKFLKPASNASTTSTEDSASQNKKIDTLGRLDRKYPRDDNVSIASTNTTYTKRMTNSLRKSFRSLKTDIIEMKPFGKKSSDKNRPDTVTVAK